MLADQLGAGGGQTAAAGGQILFYMICEHWGRRGKVYGGNRGFSKLSSKLCLSRLLQQYKLLFWDSKSSIIVALLINPFRSVFISTFYIFF